MEIFNFSNYCMINQEFVENIKNFDKVDFLSDVVFPIEMIYREKYKLSVFFIDYIFG